jgi:beta-lactam-binding protein with PASTA domain
MRRNAILFAVIKILLLCFGVVGVLGLVFLFWIIPHQVHTPEVAVPNLVGQSYQQAVLLITSSGLAVDPVQEKKPSPDFPVGQVIEQEPSANFKIKLNKPIRLTLSSGSEQVAIPDVTGRLLTDAEMLLTDVGLQRGRVAAVYTDRYPEVHTVIAQTPRATTLHPYDGEVHLLLSLGIRSKVLRMPDLRLMPIDEARSLLESHGLQIGEPVYKLHPEIDQGVIISHQPSVGELIWVGQAINFDVSGSQRKKEDKGGYLEIKYTVSPTGASHKRVRIVVEDERKKLIKVVDELCQSGTLVEKPPVRVVGKATMRIYEDNLLVDTRESDW